MYVFLIIDPTTRSIQWWAELEGELKTEAFEQAFLTLVTQSHGTTCKLHQDEPGQLEWQMSNGQLEHDDL